MSTKATGKYFEGVGRRKTAIARVRIVAGKSNDFKVNDLTSKDYFKLQRLMMYALSPLTSLKLDGHYSITAHVKGGGIAAQAQAVRHGLARALQKADQTLTQRLRVFGFLTRDSRMVERKKYGLKKARRAPQWQKR